MASPITLDGSGLSLGQKLALAATMFCKPCCGGSGSGGGSSGSGGDTGSNYCGCSDDDFDRATSLFATVEVDCMGLTDTVELTRSYDGGCVVFEGSKIVGEASSGTATACGDDIGVNVDLDFTYAINVNIGCVPCTGLNCVGDTTSIWLMQVNVEGNAAGVYYSIGYGASLLHYHRITLSDCSPIVFNEKILEAVCYIPITFNGDLDCFACCTGVPQACDFIQGCTDQIPTDFTSGVGCLVTVNISE